MVTLLMLAVTFSKVCEAKTESINKNHQDPNFIWVLRCASLITFRSSLCSICAGVSSSSSSTRAGRGAVASEIGSCWGTSINEVSDSFVDGLVFGASVALLAALGSFSLFSLLASSFSGRLKGARSFFFALALL